MLVHSSQPYTLGIQHIAAELPQYCLRAGRFATTVMPMTQSSTAAVRRYDKQRKRKTPPHITLKAHRISHNLSLEDIADRVEEQTGDRPTKGALSAIENGLRGVSAELLSALEDAYELPIGSITTDYEPRSTPSTAA